MKRFLSSILVLCMSAAILSSCGKPEKIEFGNYGGVISWKVLDVKDDKMLLISEKILEWKYFDDESEDVTWHNSSLRKWLNNEFYNEAFSEDEQKRILSTNIENPYSLLPKSTSVIGGKTEATTDKIFLLSEAEIEEYFKNSEERCADLTDKSYETQVNYKPETGYEMLAKDVWCKGHKWWTRTVHEQGAIICVGDNGSIGMEHPTNKEEIKHIPFGKVDEGAGVRPAMWITIENSK